jgi:hypothetical protein
VETIYLQRMTWLPDESDGMVLCDFTVRRENGEPVDLNFRVSEVALPKEVGIRLIAFKRRPGDPVLSDYHAHVTVPSETVTMWGSVRDVQRRLYQLTLLIAHTYLSGRQTVDNDGTIDNAS